LSAIADNNGGTDSRDPLHSPRDSRPDGPSDRALPAGTALAQTCGMRETRDPHECLNPSCGRTFLVVYKHDPARPVLPLHLACPYCGLREFLLVGTAGRVESDGTYVMALDYHVEAAES
jgi:hypothetical protein